MSNGNDDDDIEIIGGLDPQLMAAAKDDDSDDRSLTDLVEQPAKGQRPGDAAPYCIFWHQRGIGLGCGCRGVCVF